MAEPAAPFARTKGDEFMALVPLGDLESAGDAMVVSARLPRMTLAQLGLPVNPPRACDGIHTRVPARRARCGCHRHRVAGSPRRLRARRALRLLGLMSRQESLMFTLFARRPLAAALAALAVAAFGTAYAASDATQRERPPREVPAMPDVDALKAQAR